MVVTELPIGCAVIHTWTRRGSLHHARAIVLGIDRNYDPPVYTISFEKNNREKTVERSSLEPSCASVEPAVDLTCSESIDSMPSAGADVEEMLSASNPERVGAAAANEYGLPRWFGGRERSTLGKRPSSPTEKDATHTGPCDKDGGLHNNEGGATTSARKPTRTDQEKHDDEKTDGAVLHDLGPVGKKKRSLDPRVLRDLDGEATLENIEKAMKSSSQNARLLSRLGKQVAHALV